MSLKTPQALETQLWPLFRSFEVFSLLQIQSRECNSFVCPETNSRANYENVNKPFFKDLPLSLRMQFIFATFYEILAYF